MKRNYTKQQIEEILDVMTNPEDFAGFIYGMYNLCSHQVSEYPEDGSYFALLTDNVYEAVCLYKHPEEAKRKYQSVEEALNNDDEEAWLEVERIREKERDYNLEQFGQWYDSLTPQQQEEFDSTGHITK